jgi:uncharacterized damage-inducible protein DinB
VNDIFHADERTMLERHLDGLRATVVRKVSGVTWADATRRLGPSATSIAGILKHLIEVERWWFRYHLAGEDGVPFWSTDDDPDGDFDVTGEGTIEAMVAEYEAECANSRAIAATRTLDDECVRAGRSGDRPTLRWLYVHLVEELARHAGHLDIYRELIDGTTGRWLDDRRAP